MTTPMPWRARPRLLVALALLGACAAPPAAPPAAPAAPAPTPAAADMPLDEKPRWITSGGATIIGPELPGGTLVLLGGRRALLHRDGTLEPEKTPSPEPLFGVVLVATSAGDRLVAHSKTSLYRLDEPLGAPTLLATGRGMDSIERIAAGPGFVAVWQLDPTVPPVMLDPTTGDQRGFDGWPSVRVADMAFRTPREGAVFFEALGLAVTSDGGQTFHSPTGEQPDHVAHVKRLARRGDRVFALHDGYAGAIDLTKRRMAPLLGEGPPVAPMLRWIAKTGLDPLRLAVDRGARGSPRDTAFVAASGLLARVRLDSGAVTDVVDLPERPMTDQERMIATMMRSVDAPPCTVVRRIGRGFVLCGGQRPFAFALAGPLSLESPEKLGSADLWIAPIPIHRSPSGGVGFVGGCSSANRSSDSCTMTRSGKFEPQPRGAGLLDEHSTGVLADGRVVHLDDSSLGEPGKPQFVIFARDGKENRLPPITLPGDLRVVVLGVEEAPDGALRALLQSHGTVLGVRQTIDGHAAKVASVDGYTAVFRDGRAVVSGSYLRASEDGGMTWVEIQGPLDHALSKIDVEVSEIGLRIADHLRIGWGGDAPYRRRADLPTTPLIAWKERKIGPDRKLVCKTQGDAGPAPPFEDEAAMRAFLEQKSGKPPNGGRHERSYHRHGYPVLLDASASTAAAASPERWTLWWIDPRDPSGRVRRSSLAAPSGARWDAVVREVASAGDRVVLQIGPDPGGHVVDIPARGPARVAALPGVNVYDIVIGAGERGAVAWQADGAFLWKLGDTPRKIARWGAEISSARVRLAAPGADSVPVLLSGEGWASTRTLPVGGSARLPFDGWQPVRASGSDLAFLAPCTAKARGDVFDVAGYVTFQVELDGHRIGGEHVYGAHFAARIDGASACLARVEAPIRATPASKVRADAMNHIWVDLGSGRGHGIEAGPRARLRRLSCALR
jgi:hypothetical protein